MAEQSTGGHIVAFGGLSMAERAHEPAFRYLAALTGAARPRVCYVPTASSEAYDHVVNFYGLAERLDWHAAHLSLFKLPTADLRAFVLAHDIVYVGGGNTKSMLALWREWGLDAILREAWEAGVVLAGVSAGAICWFEQGITDSIPGPLTPLACLGYLPGAMCPHYDGEPERRPSFHRMLSERAIGAGYAAEDGVGLHYTGTRLARILTALPGKAAYRLELDDGAVRETRLEAEALG